MTEDISKMKSIQAAYKGHCTQDFKKAEKLITSKSSKSSDHAVFGDRRRYSKRHRISPIV